MSNATGQYLCGAVKYSIEGEPLRMAQCHCKDCQRASGTGHMSLALVKEDQISIDGKFSEYSSVADSGNETIRGFCPTCGARLFACNSARAGILAVTASCADNNSWFNPQALSTARTNLAGIVCLRSCQVSLPCQHHQSDREFDMFLPKTTVTQ